MSNYKGVLRDMCQFVIFGEPCSKANSRQLVTNKQTSKTMFIKSKKALAYVDAFKIQCPQVDPPLTDDLKVTIKIFYASRRPDLDESVILDCMQTEMSKKIKGKDRLVLRKNIYHNDRQVKEKHIYWALDRDNPRAEITVETLL
jgi:asparagine synthetase B (glutamine-hydrolysing)